MTNRPSTCRAAGAALLALAACAPAASHPDADPVPAPASPEPQTAVVSLPAPAPRQEPLAATALPTVKTSAPSGMTPADANAVAPAVFTIAFDTSKGTFSAVCHKAWAPKAANRLYNLAQLGYFDDTIFFRVIKDPRPFVVQWGIHGDPAVNKAWENAKLEPDPVTQTNRRGTLTFAMGGQPPTLTTQVFVNLADNGRLDAMGFAPVCQIDPAGMKVVDSFFGGYEGKPSNDQPRIQAEGNTFLRSTYPELDSVLRAKVSALP